MSQSAHTYGTTCRLAHEVASTGATNDTDVPPLRAQFFYASALPIDDPLSAVTIPSGSDSKSIKHEPRPFSTLDNSALEEAWTKFSRAGKKKGKNSLRGSKPSSPGRRNSPEEIKDSYTSLYDGDFAAEFRVYNDEGSPGNGMEPPADDEVEQPCCSPKKSDPFFDYCPEDEPLCCSHEKPFAEPQLSGSPDQQNSTPAMQTTKPESSSGPEGNTAPDSKQKEHDDNRCVNNPPSREYGHEDSFLAACTSGSCLDQNLRRRYAAQANAVNSDLAAEDSQPSCCDEFEADSKHQTDSVSKHNDENEKDKGKKSAKESKAMMKASKKHLDLEAGAEHDAENPSPVENEEIAHKKSAKERKATKKIPKKQPELIGGAEHELEHPSTDENDKDSSKGNDEERKAGTKVSKKPELLSGAEHDIEDHPSSDETDSDELERNARKSKSKKETKKPCKIMAGKEHNLEDDLSSDEHSDSGKANEAKKPRNEEAKGKNFVDDLGRLAARFTAHDSALDPRDVSDSETPAANEDNSHQVRRSFLESQRDGAFESRPITMADCEDPTEHEIVAKHLNCRSHRAYVAHFKDGHGQTPLDGDVDAPINCPSPEEHENVLKHLECRSHRALLAHFMKEHGKDTHHEDEVDVHAMPKTSLHSKKLKNKYGQPVGPEGTAMLDGSPSVSAKPELSKKKARLPKNSDKFSEPEGKENVHEKPETKSKKSGKGKSKERETQEMPDHDVHTDSVLPVLNTIAATTGRPFARLPSRRETVASHPQDEVSTPPDDSDKETMSVPGCKAYKKIKEEAAVLVGASRLHLVTLPSLQMKPIYWSPVHDIASVTRGTWFYKDTMCPVEPAVANQLELGYRELRPWSQTWKDELRSAIEVGAPGEEKIAHYLWPKSQPSPRKNGLHTLSTDPHCAARCFNSEAAAEGADEAEGPDAQYNKMKLMTKKHANAQVIYMDKQNAFILKPTLQPSAYYGRKPLQKIAKGHTVGVHVVRGFDRKTWEKLHPSKKNAVVVKAEQAAPVGKPNSCPGCEEEESRPKVTDLILVIHGIGQKLSERMESFNFTHAINAFRRSVNVDLVNEHVKSVVRKDLGDVMVLPVNWRSNLSFEEGGPMKDDDEQSSDSRFTMKDITIDTIPAVRNIISDVMLDIPFYMSHHKPKMVESVIKEANRVYRLWCQNNPGFHKEGRVHIIAHSLGSVMALDILSNQPTSLPRFNMTGKKVSCKNFEFPTTNLFLAGSPAGFFLHLEKAVLLPRKGQGKPEAEDGDDKDQSIVGSAGMFGCLAVDNIYNIMHYNDPIAYRLNAAVDTQYAANLKNAQVPSATTGFFESIGNAITRRNGTRSSSNGAGKPAGVKRLPSQLEMEVHDFTREEIAEKKFHLLNDNGQIDWFLSSGGALEIQYINMLGAHSSYWTSPEFVRFIVVEVGREPGKQHTLSSMKAVKELKATRKA